MISGGAAEAKDAIVVKDKRIAIDRFLTITAIQLADPAQTVSARSRDF
jgi:hypothetical protein